MTLMLSGFFGRLVQGGAAYSAAQWWTANACLAFSFAMAYAIAVVVFRLPLPGLGSAHLFRIALLMHVELAVFFWLMATAGALWSAALGAAASRAPAALAALATTLTALSPLAGGEPWMLDYFPWLAGNGGFAAGLLLFCGAVLWVAVRVLVAELAGRLVASSHGVGLSAIPALMAALAGALSWLGGVGAIADVAWAAGHTLLFGHVALMLWEWSQLAGGDSRLARNAAWLLAAVSSVLALVPLFATPGSADFHAAYTAAMRWLLWPPALVAGLALWPRIRAGGIGFGLAPRIFAISFALLVAGCLLGALIDEPTTLVTAHYHATMGAVAISRMGTGYRLAGRLAFAQPGLAACRRQLAAYATGLVLLAAGLAVASLEGAPRKTSAGEAAHHGSYYRAGMSISGLGGLFALLGSGWLVANLCWPRRQRAPAEHRSLGGVSANGS